MPDIVASATEALQMIGSANLQIDLTELPLDDVEKAWTTDYGRRRVHHLTRTSNPASTPP